MISICDMKSRGSSFCSLKSLSKRRWTSLEGEPENTPQNRLTHSKDDTVLGERREINPISQKRDWILGVLPLNVFFPFWTAASENDTTHCFWPICKGNLNMQKLFLKFKQCSYIFSGNSNYISLTNDTACCLNSLILHRKQVEPSCLATPGTGMQKESNFCASLWKLHSKDCPSRSTLNL